MAIDVSQTDHQETHFSLIKIAYDWLKLISLLQNQEYVYMSLLPTLLQQNFKSEYLKLEQAVESNTTTRLKAEASGESLSKSADSPLFQFLLAIVA